MILRRPKPPDSIQIHAIPYVPRKPLKLKHLKTGNFGLGPKTALGTVDRMISFNNLEVDHLSKRQVVASDIHTNGAISEPFVEFSSSISTTFGKAFVCPCHYPSDFKRVA